MNERILHFKDLAQKADIPRIEYYPVRLAGYGRPGTGQSATLQELANRSGITLHRAGEGKREKIREETGEEIIGHVPTSVRENRSIDDDIRCWLLEASEENKIIVDAKLSSVIARELGVDFMGILFVARAEVRYKRIRDRQVHRYIKQTGLSQKDVAKLPQFTLKAIQIATLEREKGYQEEFEHTHPQLAGIDIFNPVNRDIHGNPIHHFPLNTTNLSVIETADLVEGVLLSKYLEVQKEKSKSTITVGISLSS